MLRKRSFYLKTKILNLLRRGDSRLKATRKMTEMIIDFILSSLKGKKPIVLTSIWPPSEIFYALDLIPLNVESVAASLAGLGLSDEYLAVAEKHHHSPETCSFLRCALGVAIERLFPQPMAVVATSHLCDAGAKMTYTASQIYRCEYFLIDVPQERGEDAVDYVASQLEEMTEKLAEISRRKIEKEKLSSAVKLSNLARAYALQANELRKAVPSPMRGSEALSYLYLIGVGFGSKKATEIYKSMARELGERVRKKFSPLGRERHRLLWLHVKPYFQTNLFRYLEIERKVSIAFEEMNHIAWNELNPEDPFRSIARRLIFNLGNFPLDSYLEVLSNISKEYRIDGVIHYAHWGCRWNYGRGKIVKDALNSLGIPLLSLDCDSASRRGYSEERVQNQIDAFLEMLG